MALEWGNRWGTKRVHYSRLRGRGEGVIYHNPYTDKREVGATGIRRYFSVKYAGKIYGVMSLPNPSGSSMSSVISAAQLVRNWAA